MPVLIGFQSWNYSILISVWLAGKTINEFSLCHQFQDQWHRVSEVFEETQHKPSTIRNNFIFITLLMANIVRYRIWIQHQFEKRFGRFGARRYGFLNFLSIGKIIKFWKVQCGDHLWLKLNSEWSNKLYPAKFFKGQEANAKNLFN